MTAPSEPIPAVARQIRIGEPLPFSVYDRHDNLLLRKGFVITSAVQRDRLFEQGVFRHQSGDSNDSFTTASRYTVFETIEILMARLERAYAQLSTDSRRQFPYLCLGIAVDIQRLCEDNPDAILAGMQISHQLPYNLIHPLHCGVLCELLAKALNLPMLERLGLVAGAISHDVGIAELQEQLHRQKLPLSDRQWQQVQRHPEASVQLLQKAGVDDPVWLDVVHQHHERLDGSGYPLGLQGEQIRRKARLLAIVDVYTAMIRPRIYRDAWVARDALRDLFQDQGATVDPQLVRLFVRHIGIFPPGAFVRLANGEVAVIQKRGKEANRPHCFAIVNTEGEPYTKPRERDTNEAAHRIEEVLPHHDHPALHSHLNVLWPPLRAISDH